MPAPLAMPVTVTGFPSTVTCRVAALGKASVVMMPSRAFQKPREERTPQAARIPACILSQGGSTPILPVEEGNTSFSSVPSVRPTNAQESSARRSPSCPVEALALPLLTTIAWRRPALTRFWRACALPHGHPSLRPPWGAHRLISGSCARAGAQSRAKRAVSVRQRQEIQEVPRRVISLDSRLITRRGTSCISCRCRKDTARFALLWAPARAQLPEIKRCAPHGGRNEGCPCGSAQARQKRVKAGRLQAIVVNSGNANASTGQLGLRLALDSCALVGRTLGTDEKLVLPSSTGKIGVLPPWDKMQAGILAACGVLSSRGFWNALDGIMTTDAFPKAATRHVTVDGKPVTVA